jgi:hypothetical protein
VNNELDANRLSTIFLRHGKRGTYTDLFDNLMPDKQQMLLNAISLKDNEHPVVACVKAVDNWFLLTTNRAIWTSAGKYQEINVHDISRATFDKEALLRDKDALIRGDVTLADLQHLVVTTMDNTRHLIEVEAGFPLGGIWNVLHTFGMNNNEKKNA